VHPSKFSSSDFASQSKQALDGTTGTWAPGNVGSDSTASRTAKSTKMRKHVEVIVRIDIFCVSDFRGLSNLYVNFARRIIEITGGRIGGAVSL